jgi:hypothetical protein
MDASRRIAATTGAARDTLLDAALACAQSDADGNQRLHCEWLLARVDRPRAIRALDSPPPARRAEDWNAFARLVRAYPEPGALEAHLRALRLIPVGRLAVPDDEPIDGESYLVAAGRATMFDSETDRFPNETDSLLHMLAPMAGGALDNVVFEEVPPPQPDDPAPYQLHAYIRGERFEVAARNDVGDYYDLEAVLGLLNTLLREQQSDVRFITLATSDQEAHVAAGPIEGLRAAVSERLLVTDDAMHAAREGGAADDLLHQRLNP